jgi:hypothetical protein
MSSRPEPVLDLGDYTIFGHTAYSERIALLPRAVYDTAHAIDSVGRHNFSA